MNSQVHNILILDDNFPKRAKRQPSPERELDVEEQWEIAKQVLPDADPSYLQLKVTELANDPEKLKDFIANCIEKKGYPTMQEYLRYR